METTTSAMFRPLARLKRLSPGHAAYLVLRLALAGVFIYAGAAKLLAPAEFARTIASYGLAPDPLIPVAALGLPALELIAGVGLVLEVRGSLALISAMLVLFTVVLWFGLLSGLEVDCGCFSAAEQAQYHSLRQALWRDLLMLAGSAYLYLWRAFGPGRWCPRFNFNSKSPEGDPKCAE